MRWNYNSRTREAAVRKAMEEALPALRAFARGLCLDRMSADDLVQSACERAIKRVGQVTDISGVKSWMNRIVYTQWQDTLRRRHRNRTKILELSLHRANSEDYSHRNCERTQVARLDVEKALSKLSSDARAAVVLVVMIGYSYQEAALILELPAGTVASRVARGRLQLAETLKKDGQKERTMSSREKGVSR